MQPLVLAIEPDLRQAAIVKRIVREKVQANVTVVDSRDAALEAIRTSMPDVLLLSALLSPRDETELIAHLRTLEDAQHLQTQTIPQLASMIGDGDEKRTRGLLSAFRRRKESANVPAGCDPDLFADEIRTYLQRAADRKRELREALALGGVRSPGPASRVVAEPAFSEEGAAAAEPAASSWASPFEWRPSTAKPAAHGREAHAATPEPAFGVHASQIVAQAPGESTETYVATPASSIITPEPDVVSAEPSIPYEPLFTAVEPPAADTESAFTIPEPASVDLDVHVPLEAVAESAIAGDEFRPISLDSPALTDVSPIAESAPAAVTAPAARPELARAEPALSIRRPRPQLVVRQPQGWWYVEGKGNAAAADPESELREVLANLSVPRTIAEVGYAEGCRIRRVRLTAA